LLIKKFLSFGIIILFLGVVINSTVAINIPLNPISIGKTLYVGGTGPDNYTSIQDAINDASDGDTVFVFNGIYYENVEVDKSINLIGENKFTTIIDGEGNGDIVKVATDWVNISSFTINNSGLLYSGIEMKNKFNTITNNIISNDRRGFTYKDSCIVEIYAICYSESVQDGIRAFSSRKIHCKTVNLIPFNLGQIRSLLTFHGDGFP